jgi:hypothetical protein
MKRNKFKLYHALVFAVSTSVAVAQPANQFFLESLPQSVDLNPAKIHQETFHMNFPAFFMAGQTFVQGSLPGFTFSDLASSDGVGTTTISIAGMLEGIKDENYLNVGFQKNFLNYGWIKGKNYWNFSVGTSVNADLNYNEDFMNIIANGPGDDQFRNGKPVTLDGTNWNVTTYNEIGLGFSRNVNDKLRLGGKVRVLSGALNFKGSLDGVTITTPEDLSTLTISSNIEAYSASPLVYVDEVNAEGDTSQTLNEDETEANLISGLTGFSNLGGAIDLGASYQFNDRMTAYVSVRDFGMVKWNNGKKFTSKANATFTFDGFSSDELQDSTFLDDLGDSIQDIFKLNETEEAYTTYLPTRFFIGGEYRLNKQFSANALYSGRIANNKLQSTVVAGFGWMPHKVFEARVSYTIQNGTYDNVGLAAVLSLGAWQLYFMTDNILAFGALDYANNVNAAFGSNLTFGRKEYFEDRKDGFQTGDEKVKSKAEKASTPVAKPEVKPEVKPEEKAVEPADSAKKNEVLIKDKPEVEDVNPSAVESPEEKVKEGTTEAVEEVNPAKAAKLSPSKENSGVTTPTVPSSEVIKAGAAGAVGAAAAGAAVKLIGGAEQDSLSTSKVTALDSLNAKATGEVADSLNTPEEAVLSADSLNNGDSLLNKSEMIKPLLDVSDSLKTSTGAIKPISAGDVKVEQVTEVAKSVGTSSAVDASSKELKSGDDVKVLDKTIETINAEGEQKVKTLPADMK